jgi:hypothetical protein
MSLAVVVEISQVVSIFRPRFHSLANFVTQCSCIVYECYILTYTAECACATVTEKIKAISNYIRCSLA